jgi:hypothetical protein
MKIISDTAVRTGYDHGSNSETGQDYAMCGEHRGTSFAVVSDGCSMAGRTDIGARLLCLAARKCAGETSVRDYAMVLRHLRDIVSRQKQELALDDSDLYATCLMACVREDEVRVLVYGDGVLAVRYRDGSGCLEHYEWGYNSPPFPMSSEEDLRRKVEMESHLSVTRQQISSSRSHTFPPESASVPLLQHAGFCTRVFDAKSLADVVLFTDGVNKVMSDAGMMPWDDVVADLMAFSPSSTSEGWARKTMNGFCTRVERAGYKIYDDLSCAVLHFDHDQ